MAKLLLLNLSLIAALIGTLYGFSQPDHLSVWPKRAFNALSILESSLISLGIGHLIGELGKAIRWKILASWGHKVWEVSYKI